jgi:nucleotide-binding universal stress UspA family protein
MPLFTHLFVATDFSDGSNAAVDAAAALARESGARVTLFHAFDPDPLIPPGAIPNPAEYRDKIVKEMDAAVHKALEELKATKLAGVANIDCVVGQESSAAQAICEAAKAAGADLIVISTHGRSGLAHLLIGSVAERVIRHAHCAVLAVREPKKH